MVATEAAQQSFQVGRTGEGHLAMGWSFFFPALPGAQMQGVRSGAARQSEGYCSLPFCPETQPSPIN